MDITKRRNKNVAAAFISALSDCGFSERVSNASSDPSWAFVGETIIKWKNSIMSNYSGSRNKWGSRKGRIAVALTIANGGQNK